MTILRSLPPCIPDFHLPNYPGTCRWAFLCYDFLACALNFYDYYLVIVLDVSFVLIQKLGSCGCLVAACGCLWLPVAACGCLWLFVAACGCRLLPVAACGCRCCILKLWRKVGFWLSGIFPLRELQKSHGSGGVLAV